ncbi:aromatic amino acid lyase [uncultured Cohaesibacter sp.]|uniref:aromatic amino acid lyase n=1 Tax=uncultured Cohaesibacter sp. TaxID=1002546 RepID=UPI0029C62D67|nr:aromatic amino acid lyase [uncultured Cohaesibacter sp.]
MMDGRSLTLGQLEDIANRRGQIMTCPTALEQVEKARRAVELAVENGTAAYGVTTSVGAYKDCAIDAGAMHDFNMRLLRAHSFAIGTPMSVEEVRAAIALRINASLTGHAGIHPELLIALHNLLERDVIPEGAADWFSRLCRYRPDGPDRGPRWSGRASPMSEESACLLFRLWNRQDWCPIGPKARRGWCW